MMSDPNSQPSPPALWRYQMQVSKRLLAWSGFSILSALVIFRPRPFSQALASQFLAWGSIDAVIAWFGQISTRRQIEDHPAPTQEDLLEQTHRFRRLLGINSLLDIGYILGGLWLHRSQGGDDPARRGHGLGIMIQGGFLLFFDLLHLAWVPNDPAATFATGAHEGDDD